MKGRMESSERHVNSHFSADRECHLPDTCWAGQELVGGAFLFAILNGTFYLTPQHFKTDAALQNLVRYYASQANDYADLKSDDFFKIVYHGAYKYHFKSLSMHGRDKYSHFARIRFFIGEITNAEYDNLKTSDLDHHPGKPAGVSNALFNAVLVDASLSAMIKATAEQRAKWKAAAKAKNKSKKNMLRNKRKQPDFTNDGIDTAGTSTTRAGTSAETMQNNRAKKTAVIPRRTTNEPRQESAQPPGGLLPEVGERFLVSLPNFQFGPKIGKMTFNRFMTNEAFWKFVDSDEDYNLIRDAIDEADKEAREASKFKQSQHLNYGNTFQCFSLRTCRRRGSSKAGGGSAERA